MEKNIMFQSGDIGHENICIFAKLRNSNFYFYPQSDDTIEFEDIEELLQFEIEVFKEDEEARRNLANRIIRLKELLVIKFNNANGTKLKTIL